MRKAIGIITGISFLLFIIGAAAIESATAFPFIIAGVGIVGMFATGAYWRKNL